MLPDQSSPSTREDQVSVSVVLPVLNEARDIGRLLGEIFSQTPPPGGFEVLVADGGSTDSTRQIVAESTRTWSNLKLLDNPRKLSSAGRNVGARAARGRYVVFLDGHCRLPRQNYLVRLVELFESTGAACLCRPQPLDQITEGQWAAAISAARHSPLGHNPGSDIYRGEPGYTDPESAGAAYLRAIIAALGGYDERFDACEDVEFNHRVGLAGLTAYRHPDLAVAYRPRETLRGLFRQMLRYGRGRARLMARHPGMVPWPLVGVTGYVILAVLAAIRFGPSIGGLMLAVPAVAVAALFGAEGLRLGGLGLQAARIACTFWVISFGLTLGFWKGLGDILRFRPAPAREPGTP